MKAIDGASILANELGSRSVLFALSSPSRGLTVRWTGLWYPLYHVTAVALNDFIRIRADVALLLALCTLRGADPRILPGVNRSVPGCRLKVIAFPAPQRLRSEGSATSFRPLSSLPAVPNSPAVTGPRSMPQLVRLGKGFPELSTVSDTYRLHLFWSF